MKKEEFIAKYGVVAWQKHVVSASAWNKGHPKEHTATNLRWVKKHPEAVAVRRAKEQKKEGEYYKRMQKYQHTGLQGERNTVRKRHWKRWHKYKRIIAPNCQLHHQWQSQSAFYDGLALVEADQHMHGFIDVIRILEGVITLFTEEEVRKGVQRRQ